MRERESTQNVRSLDGDFEVEFGVAGDGDGDGFGEEGFQDGGVAPLEVPAVAKGQQRIRAGHDIREGEAAVAVALISAVEFRIALQVFIFGHQQDHHAGNTIWRRAWRHADILIRCRGRTRRQASLASTGFDDCKAVDRADTIGDKHTQLGRAAIKVQTVSTPAGAFAGDVVHGVYRTIEDGESVGVGLLRECGARKERER